MTTTATAPRFATFVLPSLRMSIRYMEMLTADVPAEKFAHIPAKNVNHAAFNIGHLSLYAERVLEFVGKPELMKPDPKFIELFKAGTPCVEQDGRYPAKDVICKRYVDRWNAVAEVLPEIPDETFWKQNPMEGRMREMVPTVGAAVTFLCGGHNMSHLGQVSTWRRLIGLGSVM